MSTDDKAAVSPPGLPLERKIPLIVLALFAFVLGTGIVVSYYEVRHAAELAAADRLKSLSGAIASVAAQPVTSRVQNLRRVAGDPTIVDALRHPDRPYGPEIRRAMSPVLNTPADTGVTGLWTRAGRPLGTLALELPEQRQSIHEEIERVERGDSLAVGSFRSANRRTAYWIVVPVLDRDSTRLGYLAQERVVANNPAALRGVNGLMGPEIDGFL